MLLSALCAFFAAASAASTFKDYRNPVIPGFHPDPSCIHVKEWADTFFCATSSFNAFPGIPIFASNDLVNFKQIGNVLNQQSQLPGLAHTNGSTSGIWAPALRFHNGTFFVVTTLVYDHLPQNDSSRWDNMIFKTADPYSDAWSDPVHFTFEGYDTSPFWDDAGRSYIQGSHAWRVRPVIQGFEIDMGTGATGTVMDLWKGISGGIAPEAPHLFQKDGFYYLMIAEGGTGLDHMVTMARSQSIWGPFEPNPTNPVLTNANTSQYFQTVGHADLFTDSDGNWWAVALSTRSGPDYRYFPMGRETVLTPVTWKTGRWPAFRPVRGEESGPLRAENRNIGGNGTWVEAAEHLTFVPDSTLPKHFIYNRFPDPGAYTVSPPGHPRTIRLIPSLLNLTALEGRLAATPQTFVGRRQEHVQFKLEATLNFDPKQDEEEAGLTVFLNQAQHFDLGVVALSPQAAVLAGYTGTLTNATGLARYIRLRTISANSSDLGAHDAISKPAILSFGQEGDHSGGVHLQIDAVNNTVYAFRYKSRSVWKTVGWGVSSEVSGGFTGEFVGKMGDTWPRKVAEIDFQGTVLGMFATGNGKEGLDPAYFSEFSYVGNPNVF